MQRLYPRHISPGGALTRTMSIYMRIILCDTILKALYYYAGVVILIAVHRHHQSIDHNTMFHQSKHSIFYIRYFVFMQNIA